MKNRNKMLSQHGFTLIELLITVAISGILMAGVYTAFMSQQNSYLAQEEVAEVQQNIRSGLDVMVRDIRMAGYDPNRSGIYGITTATANLFVFTLDAPENPGALLERNYELYSPAYPPYDDVNYSGMALRRTAGGTAIAEDIKELEFLYVLADGTQLLAPTAAQFEDIRSIQISILARARQPDRNYTNNLFYCPASNPFDSVTGDCEEPDEMLAAKWGPFNAPDNLRRRFQITTVKLRNMGLSR